MLSWEARYRNAVDHVVPFLRRTIGLTGGRVIDFGAGQGAVACALAPHVDELLGLDILENDIDKATRRAGAAGHAHLRFEAGRFESLLARARDFGTADVFLVFAVLEHMTVAERLATLEVAREVLAADGSLCVFETPNRLLWWDHHTSTLPFFGMLPDELALAYAARSPREDFTRALAAGGEEPTLNLARWGRAVSQHEFELVFGDLEGKILAGGYEPELFPIRHVHREELAFARFMRSLPEPPSSVFSRYWLDLVVNPGGRVKPTALAQPWPFSTSYGEGAVVSPAETLMLLRPGAWVRVPAENATSVILGMERRGEATGVRLEVDGAAAGSFEVPGGEPTTVFGELSLPAGGGALNLQTERFAELSFVAVRSTPGEG